MNKVLMPGDKLWDRKGAEIYIIVTEYKGRAEDRSDILEYRAFSMLTYQLSEARGWTIEEMVKELEAIEEVTFQL